MSDATTAVYTECCGAMIVTTNMGDVQWRECADCGQVVD
jgi:hypothetical protein